MGYFQTITQSLLCLAGSHDFSSGACDRLEGYLSSELVGQELAVHQACDAICDHLAIEEPQKPLVLSAHGPPGVGKSMMHLLLARALYSRHPDDQLKCPGKHCLGYKASLCHYQDLFVVWTPLQSK